MQNTFKNFRITQSQIYKTHLNTKFYNKAVERLSSLSTFASWKTIVIISLQELLILSATNHTHKEFLHIHNSLIKSSTSKT